MKKLYIISFSSFYKAAYARDKLSENGFRASVRRLPPELVKSCGYGIYIKTADIGEVKRYHIQYPSGACSVITFIS